MHIEVKLEIAKLIFLLAGATHKVRLNVLRISETCIPSIWGDKIEVKQAIDCPYDKSGQMTYDFIHVVAFSLCHNFMRGYVDFPFAFQNAVEFCDDKEGVKHLLSTFEDISAT